MQSSDIILSKRFVFIIGAPRSGTTWLHEMISLHSDVASVAPIEQTIFANYIPDFISTWEKQKKAITDKKWNQGLPFIWNQEELDEFIIDFIRKVYIKISDKKPEATLIVDKQPNYSNHLSLIKKYIPNAKFIHILRDGRDVVCSSRNAFKKVGFMHNEIEIMAEKWVRFNVNIDTHVSNSPSDILSVRYEELIDELKTTEILKNIFSHCDLEASDEKVNEILMKHKMSVNSTGIKNEAITHGKKIDKKNWNQVLTLKDKYIFNLYAGDYLKKVKYEMDDSWICKTMMDRLRLKLLKVRFKFKSITSK